MSLLMKSLKLVTPPIIQQMAKNVTQPKSYFIKKELHRLSLIPRYQSTTTKILGKEIEIVDSCTFLGGYYEIIEKRIYEFTALSKFPLIIDCGANIGLSVYFFKTLYPHSRVIAFEPDKKIFEVLKKNVLSFGFTDVELHQKAIWINENPVDFCVEGGYSGRIKKPSDDRNIVNVKTARLRNILDQKVDFLKIDIEGAETQVIQDCQDKLANVDYIFLEYHSHNQEPQSLHEILRILHKTGFRYHIREAFTSNHPFLERELMLGMDLQLDIFGYRN